MSGLNVERHGGGWSEYASGFRSARRFRLLIVAGGLIVGVVLIVNGHTLIGCSWPASPSLGWWPCPGSVVAGDSRGADASLQARQWLRGHARDEFVVAAAVMGIPADALRDQFEQGRSIAEVVAGGSTDLDDVIHAIIEDLVAHLHQAVGHGSLSEQDAR